LKALRALRGLLCPFFSSATGNMMKKISMLLAMVSFSSLATAQSSVTVFGTVDVGIAHLTGEQTSRTGLSTGGLNISRIGFKGTEDLGGGLSAGFWLEAGFNADDGIGKATGGGLSFNRRSTVSLLSPYGEVRLGRDDAATFLSTLIFDPFLTNGVGGTNAFVMLGAPIQIGNAVSYILPLNFGGFYGQVQHVFGEQTAVAPVSNTSAGDYNGARLGWRNTAWNVALALGKQKGVDAVADLTIKNLGVSYDFGVVKPSLLWATEKRDGGAEIRAVEAGLTAPIGKGDLRLQVSRYNTVDSNADWKKFAIGYGYNFSKRTQIYATYARLKNDNGSQRSIGVQGLVAPGNTLGGKSTGYEVGVRHFF
jgi:predicted porin